jgi:hypothetical protein
MKPSRRRGSRIAIVASIALLTGLLVSGPAPAAEVLGAEGAAFGSSDGLTQIETPTVTAAVPPNTSQHVDDATLNVMDQVTVQEVAADACIAEGVQAFLQAEMNTARVIAQGGDPAAQPEPQRRTAEVPAGYGDDDFCLTPAAQQIPQDDTTNPLCENYSGGGEAPPTTCQALIQLWNARGYAQTADVVGSFSELESEAVGRCVGAAGEFMTGVRYGPAGGVQGDPSMPNQPLNPGDFGLSSGTVTFWETNWDPETNTTTDGSNTVWVNALRIQSPTLDLVVGHSEATVDCAQGDVPAGGYPRDINLTASKGTVTYERTYTLSGAVTPATEFDTPRTCVEGVNVTIRRDMVGGEEQFEDIATVQTDTNGNFSYDVEADVNSQWIAFIDRDEPANCAQVSSAAEPVLVKPFLGLKTSRKVVRKGKTVKFTTRIEPCDGKEGTIVKLRRVFSSRNVKIDTERFNEDCRAFFFLKAKWKGTAVFDAAWSKQDTLHQNGHSRPKAVRVKKRK